MLMVSVMVRSNVYLTRLRVTVRIRSIFRFIDRVKIRVIVRVRIRGKFRFRYVDIWY